jgi:polyhydroxybutyrate depolymerase
MFGAFASLLVGLVLWAKSSGVASDVMPPQHTRLIVRTPEGSRDYVIHVPPSYDLSKPTPLVIMLHGFGGTALSAATETGWSAKADQENFIIAYPEGTRPHRDKPANFRKNPQAWNDGSGRFDAGERKVDDVAFIDAIITQIAEKYNVDSGRIFATGFSNGASMTFRIGSDLSHRVKAIAPVSGTCWMESIKPVSTIAVCYITGSADSLNPLEGGYPKLALSGKEQGGKAKPAVQTFIDQWVAALECSKLPILDETNNGVRKRMYGQRSDRGQVVWLTVEGLGHHWAGGESQAPNLLVGRNTNKLKATDVIWDFFKSQTNGEWNE